MLVQNCTLLAQTLCPGSIAEDTVIFSLRHLCRYRNPFLYLNTALNLPNIVTVHPDPASQRLPQGHRRVEHVLRLYLPAPQTDDDE